MAVPVRTSWSGLISSSVTKNTAATVHPSAIAKDSAPRYTSQVRDAERRDMTYAEAPE